jgi:hypothetical protein
MEIKINGKDPYNCTKEEILSAWDALKDAYNIIKRRATLDFTPGMHVYFESKRGIRTSGIVLKVNSTTLLIKADIGGGKWKVSSSMCHHVLKGE